MICHIAVGGLCHGQLTILSPIGKAHSNPLKVRPVAPQLPYLAASGPCAIEDSKIFPIVNFAFFPLWSLWSWGGGVGGGLLLGGGGDQAQSCMHIHVP